MGAIRYVLLLPAVLLISPAALLLSSPNRAPRCAAVVQKPNQLKPPPPSPIVDINWLGSLGVPASCVIAPSPPPTCPPPPPPLPLSCVPFSHAGCSPPAAHPRQAGPAGWLLPACNPGAESHRAPPPPWQPLPLMYKSCHAIGECRRGRVVMNPGTPIALLPFGFSMHHLGHPSDALCCPSTWGAAPPKS